MKRTIGIGFIAIGLIGVVFAGSSACAGPAAQGVGQPAPAYSLKDLDGKPVTSAALRGKVVVVNFWATWCPPCREEIPDFVEFYNENKTNGLEIIGLSVDRIAEPQLKSFVRKNKMTYPVLFADAELIRAFDPGQFIPTTFLIDKNGIIRHKQVGGLDKAALVSWFDRLSKE